MIKVLFGKVSYASLPASDNNNWLFNSFGDSVVDCIAGLLIKASDTGIKQVVQGQHALYA